LANPDGGVSCQVYFIALRDTNKNLELPDVLKAATDHYKY